MSPVNVCVRALSKFRRHLAVLVVLWGAGCGLVPQGVISVPTEDVAPPLGNADPDKLEITYEAHVLPLVLGYCGACHTSGAPPGKVAFDEYDVVAADKFSLAKAIVDAAKTGRMPPAGLPAPASVDVKVLERWQALGFPRGTPIESAEDLPANVTYDDHIRPLLGRACISCHSQAKSFGHLKLDRYDDSDATESFWSRWRRVQGQLTYGTMPPASAKLMLQPRDVALFNLWVKQGLRKSASTAAASSACAETAPAVPLRLRNNEFLANAVSSLFFTDVDVAAVTDQEVSEFGQLKDALLGLPEDYETLRLGGLGLNVTKGREQAAVGVFEDLASWAVGNDGRRVTARFTCMANTATNEVKPCLAQMFASFILAAWGRPPSMTDIDELVALYDAARALAGSDPTKAHWQGTKAALLGYFLSPEFTLQMTPKFVQGDATDLQTSVAVASLLSFRLFNSIPTKRLMAIAQNSAFPLLSRAGITSAIAQVAGEVLPSPRPSMSSSTLLQRRMAAFGEALLDLKSLPSPPADPAVNLTSSQLQRLPEDARVEVKNLFSKVLPEGSVADLFSTDLGYLISGSSLYPVYGVASSESGWVKLGRGRQGLLTRAALALNDFAPNQEVVYRGSRVAKKLLCESFEFPDDEVLKTLGAQDPKKAPEPLDVDKLSDRQRWEAKTSALQCAICHKRLNGLGFALQDFDRFGRARNQEKRNTADGKSLTFDIDTKSTLLLDGEAIESIDGTSGLSKALGQTRVANICIQQSFGAFTRGVRFDRPDMCLTERLIGNDPASTSNTFMSVAAQIVAEQVLMEVGKR